MKDEFETLPFQPADILLPQDCDLSLWSVVACDQYTSEPEYWADVEKITEGAKSALNLILPEVYLEDDNVDERIAVKLAYRGIYHKCYASLRDKQMLVKGVAK